MAEKEVKEVFFAFGHTNVRATHCSTLEFTKDKHLSQKGDCILVVGAEKGLADLSREFKESMRKANARLIITIEVDGVIEQICANGSVNLILSHASDIVIRKSHYVDSRTLAIGADKSARDLSRTLVEKLRDPKQKTRITLRVNS